MRCVLIGTVVLILASGCGSADSPSNDQDAGTSEQIPENSVTNQTSPAAKLTAAFLAGAWCSSERLNPSERISYEFGADGSVSLGKKPPLKTVSNLEKFVRGVTVVSVDDDEFVVSQVGREVVFTRGSCP